MFPDPLLSENKGYGKAHVNKNNFTNVNGNIVHHHNSSNNSLFTMNHFTPSFDTDNVVGEKNNNNNTFHQANVEGDVEADLQAKASEMLKNILDY